MAFTITDQGTTRVDFVFRAGEDLIQMGNGQLEFGLIVEDGEPGGDGDGDAPPLEPEDHPAECRNRIDGGLQNLATTLNTSNAPFVTSRVGNFHTHINRPENTLQYNALNRSRTLILTD